MAGYMKVLAIGNLGGDPDVRHTPGGAKVASFSLAVNEKWKDRDGNLKERTEWVRVQAWGKLADLCAQYLTKGRAAMVEGRLRTRQYEKEGQRHYATEVIADRVIFLGGAPSSGGGGGQGRGQRDDRHGHGATEDFGPPPDGDDDIPF